MWISLGIDFGEKGCRVGKGYRVGDVDEFGDGEGRNVPIDLGILSSDFAVSV